VRQRKKSGSFSVTSATFATASGAKFRCAGLPGCNTGLCHALASPPAAPFHPQVDSKARKEDDHFRATREPESSVPKDPFFASPRPAPEGRRRLIDCSPKRTTDPETPPFEPASPSTYL
jgi:hypothetical protein